MHERTSCRRASTKPVWIAPEWHRHLACVGRDGKLEACSTLQIQADSAAIGQSGGAHGYRCRIRRRKAQSELAACQGNLLEVEVWPRGYRTLFWGARSSRVLAYCVSASRAGTAGSREALPRGPRAPERRFRANPVLGRAILARIGIVFPNHPPGPVTAEDSPRLTSSCPCQVAYLPSRTAQCRTRSP